MVYSLSSKSLTSTPSDPMGFWSASNLARSGGDADLAGRGGGDGERDAAVLAGSWCRRFSSERDEIVANLKNEGGS